MPPGLVIATDFAMKWLCVDRLSAFYAGSYSAVLENGTLSTTASNPSPVS